MSIATQNVVAPSRSARSLILRPARFAVPPHTGENHSHPLTRACYRP